MREFGERKHLQPGWLQWAGEPWFLRWGPLLLPSRWQGLVVTFVVTPLILAAFILTAPPNLNTTHGILWFAGMFVAMATFSYIVYTNTEVVRDGSIQFVMLVISVLSILTFWLGALIVIPAASSFLTILPTQLQSVAYLLIVFGGPILMTTIWLIYLKCTN